MNKNFCNSCTSEEITPPCIIYKTMDGQKIEDILKNKDFIKKENLVCHAYAQIYENQKLSINENCDNCELCFLMCKNTNSISYNNYDIFEKIIFNDYSKLAILLDKFCKSKIIGTNIQAKGNSRTKRIDLGIFYENKFSIFKILKDTNKIPFYYRSYKEIVKYYSQLFQNVRFDIKVLVPEKNKSCDSDLKYIVTIKDLISQFGEKNVNVVK